MPSLLPIILASSHLVLAADRVPQFSIEPTCRAASKVATALKRDMSSCKSDERDARAKLEKKWGDFSDRQRQHCVRLTSYGPTPSYVGLLTCLEVDEAARKLPADGKTGRPKFDRNGL